MKRCPECRRDYYDETLLYSLDDGEAVSHLRKAVDLFPDAQRPRSILALTYYQKSKYPEGVEQTLVRYSVIAS
jgi:hypothetical protein